MMFLFLLQLKGGYKQSPKKKFLGTKTFLCKCNKFLDLLYLFICELS